VRVLFVKALTHFGSKSISINHLIILKAIKKMIQSTFTLSGTEFNTDFLEKIRNLFRGNGQNYEIVVRVKEKETQEEANTRIERRMLEMERGENIVPFTGVEFEQLVQQLSKP
jgi:NAD+--asparagine ADP-ribosyltransferase